MTEKDNVEEKIEFLKKLKKFFDEVDYFVMKDGSIRGKDKPIKSDVLR